MYSYYIIEQALLSDIIEVKEHITNQCLQYCTQNALMTQKQYKPIHFENPSYTQRCQIVPPKSLPARKAFDTKEGLGALIHAIAHIEYSAIDLALDAVYRYQGLPQTYYQDWLEVASDEIRHFKMLEALLVELGYVYGDFPVHDGLFQAANDTVDSLLDRMAIIPRYYEASGLDVNPQIMKKLQNRRKDTEVKKLLDILEVIYQEEIIHVYKGDKWFKYMCSEIGYTHEESEAVYFDILARYYLAEKHRPHINVAARKASGFSCSEIKKLGAKECE